MTLMTTPRIIKGLYAITPDYDDTPMLIDKVAEAVEAGISVLQYRNKEASQQLKMHQASLIKDICYQNEVPFIINDDFALCDILDADGVHLGEDDATIDDVRRVLGLNRIIGISCYNDGERVQTMLSKACDYIALGACFLSSTKPNAPHASTEFIKKVMTKANKPVVAIGGINLDNCRSVLDCGVNAIAVVNDIFSSRDITQTVKTFNEILKNYEQK